MIAVSSKFAIANGMADKVKIAFSARPHLVDSAQGIYRPDVLSPRDMPNEIRLITCWQNETSFTTWHKSHMYRDSHKGIPKGLKLIPSETEIRYFDHVVS
ncbi:MAG TPA: antibiotic biosynthesis monooxygenase [Verrucomicrobiae bacterium]|nr:antibiotic biosynthesis monooxygenase [Verrucomicrobiae bacterium]